MMNMLVRDNLAFVNFCPREDLPGWVPSDYDLVGPEDGDTTFYIGSRGTERIDILNSQVVKFEEARDAVVLFFQNKSMIPNIRWTEL